MVIAIDGPAGSGKSTTAKAVAAELRFSHLDTGAMYRAVALTSIDSGIPPADAAATVRIDPGPPLLVNGEEPGERLRSPEVTAEASKVAKDTEVRRLLVAMQREILAEGDWVAEGRDICTVVAPDAEVRIWLFADEAERARRRAVEQGLDEAEVLAAQRERDTADSGHGRSTLEAAEGATRLDTTGLSVEQVVERIRAMVDAARG